MTGISAFMRRVPITGQPRKRSSQGAYAGYGIAFALLTPVLKAGTPVGIAYGIRVAGGVAPTAVMGAAFFPDRLTWTMGLGIVLVGVGVLLLESGANAPGGGRRARRQRGCKTIL